MDTNKLLEEAVPLVTTYGIRVLGVVAVVWVSFKIAGSVQRGVTQGLRLRKFDETLAIFFGNMLRWLLILGTILACLSVFGIETTSFAAVIGAAGLAVGLAFQGTLSNFAAGVMLLVFRPFKVGDYIVAAGKEGVVAELGLFVTAIDTLDNRRIYLGNTSVGSGVIENYNRASGAARRHRREHRRPRGHRRIPQGARGRGRAGARTRRDARLAGVPQGLRRRHDDVASPRVVRVRELLGRVAGHGARGRVRAGRGGGSPCRRRR